jgi:hypothetical protein
MHKRNRAEEKTSDAATTRSPADRHIFGDKGATTPAKDKDPARVESETESSEAGGVD